MYYGDYYRGDYYRGDPGLFGAIGSALKGVAKVATGVIGSVVPGPAGVVARMAGKALGTRKVDATITTVQPPTIVPPPSIGTAATKRGPTPGTTAYTPLGMPYIVKGRRRRRPNYGNVKALNRANKRIDGFVTAARKALKHTNYKVVSRSAGRGGGSRGVITRREAARALRA